jgi:hypothetical protein
MKSYLILLFLGSQALSHGASTRVNFSIQLDTLKDPNGTSLTAGTSADGDGTIFHLGYYTAATTSNPFAGDWVAMTGPGTPYQTTVGDSRNNPNGTFKLQVLFTQGSYSFTEPAVGTPTALRFYDSTSIAASTYFNAVTDTTGIFNWLAPADPTSTARLSLGLSSVGIVWQDGASSAIRTTLAVHEPSCILLEALGLGALAVRHRSN